ncbi:MAG: hypothetical protein ISS01_02095 [Nanoarchaeota archaeon]|nr:hypothetical protein [Nanoarchaeota archaeon]
MKLVVDTNILISTLLKDSLTRDLILHLDAELYSIRFTDKELMKYKNYIKKKAKINDEEFYMVLDALFNKIILIDDKIIMARMKEASKIMDNIDPDDTPFIAAALATESDIWSDDKHFEKQNKIKIWKTKDLI